MSRIETRRLYFLTNYTVAPDDDRKKFLSHLGAHLRTSGSGREKVALQGTVGRRGGGWGGSKKETLLDPTGVAF